MNPSANDGEFGIAAMHLTTPSGVLRLDLFMMRSMLVLMKILIFT